MGGRGYSSATSRKASKQETSATGKAIKAMLDARGVSVNDDDTVTLYHATPTENVSSIMKNGFIGNYSPIGGGVALENVDIRSFYSFDREWVESTWNNSNGTILEIKVPVEYIRQGAGSDNREVYLEGIVKPTGNNNVWIPDRQPTSTFYDRRALKKYGNKS